MSKRKKRQNRQRRYRPSMLAYSGPARLSAPSVAINRGLAWFAVWTRPRAERKAEQRLREAGFATFLPSEAVARRRRGVVYPVERVAIGRYLFVGLNAAEPPFGAVRDIEDVQDIVSAQGWPLRVPASILQAFADDLAGTELVLKGGAFSRLMAVMAQADDARSRLKDVQWREAA